MIDKFQEYLKTHPRLKKALLWTKWGLLVLCLSIFAFIAIAGTVVTIRNQHKNSYTASAASDPFPDDKASSFFFQGLCYWHGNSDNFVTDGKFSSYETTVSTNFDSVFLSTLCVYDYKPDGSIVFRDRFNVRSIYCEFDQSQPNEIFYINFFDRSLDYVDDPTVIEGVGYDLFDTNYAYIFFINAPDTFPSTELENFYNSLYQSCVHLNPYMGQTLTQQDVDDAYDNGYANGAASRVINPISYILEPAEEFLSIKLFGSFSIGAMLGVGLFVTIALIFLKMFAGG